MDFRKLLDPFWGFTLKTVLGIHDPRISWLPFGTKNHEMRGPPVFVFKTIKLSNCTIFLWFILYFLFCCLKLLLNMLQGISHWTGLYKLALTDRNMQVKSCLKVVLESWDDKFLISILGFQKSNIGWPQQPLTERV